MYLEGVSLSAFGKLTDIFVCFKNSVVAVNCIESKSAYMGLDYFLNSANRCVMQVVYSRPCTSLVLTMIAKDKFWHINTSGTLSFFLVHPSLLIIL